MIKEEGTVAFGPGADSCATGHGWGSGLAIVVVIVLLLIALGIVF